MHNTLLLKHFSVIVRKPVMALRNKILQSKVQNFFNIQTFQTVNGNGEAFSINYIALKLNRCIKDFHVNVAENVFFFFENCPGNRRPNVMLIIDKSINTLQPLHTIIVSYAPLKVLLACNYIPITSWSTSVIAFNCVPIIYLLYHK